MRSSLADLWVLLAGDVKSGVFIDTSDDGDDAAAATETKVVRAASAALCVWLTLNRNCLHQTKPAAGGKLQRWLVSSGVQMSSDLVKDAGCLVIVDPHTKVCLPPELLSELIWLGLVGIECDIVV